MRKNSKSNKDKKSFINKSKAELSKEILDIQDKPDVAVGIKEFEYKAMTKEK